MTEPSSRSAEQSSAWVANFGAILLCQLCIFTMFTSVFPFIPIYLHQLGEDEAGAVLWAGLIQASAPLVLIVANPVWGSLSDRMGRKNMVLRALAGGAVTMGLMGLATAAWQLWVLRLVQGATSGANTAVMALAARVLPAARLSMGLGMLQTAQFLGTSLGPLMGGIVTAALGFRGTFAVSTAVLLGVALVFVLVVREPPRVGGSAASRSVPVRQSVVLVSRAPRLRAPLLVIVAFQTAYACSLALLPLHLFALASSDAAASASAGLVLTTSALGVAAGAAVLGWLGGRVDVGLIAAVSLAAAAVLTLPQAWASDTWQFASLRFALGFAAGGVLPSLRTFLNREAEADDVLSANMGAIFRLSQSAFSAGAAFGPLAAAAVASVWSLASVHVLSSAIFGFSAVGWLLAMGGMSRRTAVA